MIFRERNGRVDRYGQERTPRIVQLVTKSVNETIREDTRILEVPEHEDEQAYRDIGSLLGAHPTGRMTCCCTGEADSLPTPERRVVSRGGIGSRG